MSKRKEVWRVISVTMLQGWRERLREACRMRDMRVEGTENGPTKFTVYVETTRTAAQVEDELRAQLQFEGWMNVQEEPA